MVLLLYSIVIKLVYLIEIQKLFIEIKNLACFILCVNLFKINSCNPLQIGVKVRFFDLRGHKVDKSPIPYRFGAFFIENIIVLFLSCQKKSSSNPIPLKILVKFELF